MKLRSAIVLVASLVTCFAQNERVSKLEARLPEPELSDTSATGAFAHILRYAKLSGGVVRVIDCEAETKYSFTVAGLTIKEALNYIVSIDKNYTWKLDGDIVNVFPRA